MAERTPPCNNIRLGSGGRVGLDDLGADDGLDPVLDPVDGGRADLGTTGLGSPSRLAGAVTDESPDALEPPVGTNSGGDALSVAVVEAGLAGEPLDGLGASGFGGVVVDADCDRFEPPDGTVVEAGLEGWWPWAGRLDTEAGRGGGAWSEALVDGADGGDGDLDEDCTHTRESTENEKNDEDVSRPARHPKTHRLEGTRDLVGLPLWRQGL